MEIIRPGVVPQKPEPEYIGICRNCNAMVKLTMPDPAVLPYSRTNPEFKVKCPTDGCGATIKLEEHVTRDCFVVRSGERRE